MVYFKPCVKDLRVRNACMTLVVCVKLQVWGGLV